MRYRIIWLVSVLFKYGERSAFARTYLRIWKTICWAPTFVGGHYRYDRQKVHFTFKNDPGARALNAFQKKNTTLPMNTLSLRYLWCDDFHSSTQLILSFFCFFISVQRMFLFRKTVKRTLGIVTRFS